MSKSFRRTPENYDGTKVTSHHVNALLPSVLDKIGSNFQDRPDLILAAWPEVIGSRLAPMTQAVSFQEGILCVKVKNSTTYSLLRQYNKHLILSNLRKKFPKVNIQNVIFRIG